MAERESETAALLRELLDEREVSRLIIRFARCIDTKDWAGYADCYARDGRLETPWGEHTGREGMAQHVERDLGGFPATQHVSATHEIEIDGDTARARSSLLATHVTDEAGTAFWTVGGHYDLRLVREDGRWRFSDVRIVPAWRFDTP